MRLFDVLRRTTSCCFLREMKIFYRAILLLLSLSAVLSMYALTPCERLMQNDAMQRALVGVHIVDVDTREVLASYNAEQALVPASLVKLFTATTIMKCYDDTHRWHTHVGYSGQVVDSVLYGDIVVRGSIDPSLANSLSPQPTITFIDSLLVAIKRANIRHIRGQIVVDASVCDMAGWGQWMAEDTGFYYGAACFGANYKGNEYKLFIRTDSVGTQPQLIGTSMPTPELQYDNFLTVATKDCAEVYTTPYTSQCVLMGAVPALRDSFSLRCAMPDAPLFMAHDLHQALQEAGVVVDGNPATDRTLRQEGRSMPCIESLLYAHASDPLGEMVRVMLHKSSNLYAEALLRYVSLQEDSIATLPEALSREYNIMGQMAVDTLAITLTDGSGLSRKNVATPRALASLLVNAYHDTRVGERLMSKLPQAGKDGSVRTFFSRNPLPGILRVKSGSMGGVLCYAGYYQHAGKTYAIVLMSNNHSAKASVVRAAYERLLRDILGRL